MVCASGGHVGVFCELVQVIERARGGVSRRDAPAAISIPPPRPVRDHLPAGTDRRQIATPRTDRCRNVIIPSRLSAPCGRCGCGTDRLACAADPGGQRDVGPLKATDLHENGASINSVARRIEFISVEPGPTVVG
jgi:hypothetical protein